MKGKTTMTIETNKTNLVRVVGTLEAQRTGHKRDEQLLTQQWNGVQGRERSLVLQVRSPFGTPFQLPLRFDILLEGEELLETSAPGDLVCAEGRLEWIQREDSRYATSSTSHGLRVTEVLFRPERIRLAAPEDEPGCDVWLQGVVRRTPRRYTHPDRRVQVAVVGLEIQVERTRRNSLARIVEPIEIQVAMQIDHEDLPALLRVGNQVVVEGMLERVIVPLRNDDPTVQDAVQALDAQWEAQHDHKAASREEQRRYQRQRQRLQHTILTRVIAGYVSLIRGTPATFEEAQALRSERRRQRSADQDARVVQESSATEQPARTQRPRRRVEQSEVLPAGTLETPSRNDHETTTGIDAQST
jgi:hypothetical protein